MEYLSRIVITTPWRLTWVKPLPNYELEVEFIDGTHGFVEMSHLIQDKNAGVFEILKNIALFNQVYIQYGVVTWPGEIDLAPDAMYDKVKK